MNSIIDIDNARREIIANSLHATVNWADYDGKWYVLRDADDDPQYDGTPVYATSAIKCYLEWHGRYGANNALDFDPADEPDFPDEDARVAFEDEWEEVDPPENAAERVAPGMGFQDTMIESSDAGFLPNFDDDSIETDEFGDFVGWDATIYHLNDGTSLFVCYDWIDPVLRYPCAMDFDEIAFDVLMAEIIRRDDHSVILPISFPNGDLFCRAF